VRWNLSFFSCRLLQNLNNFLAQPNALEYLDISSTDTTLESVSITDQLKRYSGDNATMIAAFRCTPSRLLNSPVALKRGTQLFRHKEGKGNSALVQAVLYEQFELETFKHRELQNST
jgi:hypothetical protein